MATDMSINEAIEQIGNVRVISLAMGASRSTFAREWADGTVEPSDAEKQRFEVLIEQFARVAEAESIDIARLWLQGSNTGNDDASPIEALAADRFDEVRASANHMVNDDWFS